MINKTEHKREINAVLSAIRVNKIILNLKEMLKNEKDNQFKYKRTSI